MTYVEDISKVLDEVEKVLIGKREVIERVMTVFLAGGHILIEDIPGVGKTTLALAFSKALNLNSRRMQFTPDVLPSDVIGFHILNKEKQLEYRPGAIFTNIFLADEINRTSSKTQSALLEVMEEGNVTVDGYTREVPEPFIVIATQNPVGSAGTQKLPESQLDRFMIKLTMGYPDIRSEINIMKSKQNVNPMEQVQSVLQQGELVEMKEQVEKVFIHDKVYEYIANLIMETRTSTLLELGVSPRGTIALASMAKADAFMHGREFVLPEDVENIFADVVCHRFVLNSKAKLEHVGERQIAKDILRRISAPRVG